MKKMLIILMGALILCADPVVVSAKSVVSPMIAKKISKAKSVKKKKTVKKKVVKKKAKKKKAIKKYHVKYNLGEVQGYAHELVRQYGWTEDDYNALVLLWYRESGWNLNAVNKKSGACGIPQSLPCSKMASEGKDYRTNYKTQIKWGLKYIKNRYGSPSSAWSHSQRTGWY